MKKYLFLLLCLAIGSGLFFTSYRLDHNNTDAETLKQLIAPYENELVALQYQLTVAENKIDESYEIASVLIAFYAPAPDRLPKAEGYYPILISKSPINGIGDPASWNGSWDAACCYLDKVVDTQYGRQELIQKGADTFLRNAEIATAGFDGSTYTLPYVILNNDDFNMPDQLELLGKVPGTLVFLFDMNAMSPYLAEVYLKQLRDAADAGIIRFSCLKDEMAFLYSAHWAEEARRDEFEEHRIELEARIDELQRQINELSRNWNEKHGR